MQIGWYADQIQGARDYQEDYYAVMEGNKLYTNSGVFENKKTHLKPGQTLIVLADGMGGMGHGDVAAKHAVDSFVKSFLNIFSPTFDINKTLINSLYSSNQCLADLIKNDSALNGMGCTLIAVFIDSTSSQIAWISIGDSPLWLFRDNTISLINEKHTWGKQADKIYKEKLDNGEEVDKEYFENLNSPEMLVSAVTGSPIKWVDTSDGYQQLFPGDFYIVASDGVEVLSDAYLEESLTAVSHELVNDLLTKDSIEIVSSFSKTFLKDIEKIGSSEQDNATIISLAAMPPPIQTSINENISKYNGSNHYELSESTTGKRTINKLILVSLLVVLVALSSLFLYLL